MKMYLSLFLLVAVASCNTLPSADSSLKTNGKQLLAASEEFKVWGQSFLEAANEGLDENELFRLESSASDINTKFTKAVQTVRNNLGGEEGDDDGTASSSKKVLDQLIADADNEKLSGSSKLALLSTDRLVADDTRLSIFVDLFQKRLNALDAAIEQLRELLTKTDEEITTRLPGLIEDLVDQGTSLFLIFNEAKDSFQDAVVASRPLVNAAAGEEEDFARTNPGGKTRKRRQSGRRWSIGRDGITWTNRRGNLSIGVRPTLNNGRLGAWSTFRWRF